MTSIELARLKDLLVKFSKHIDARYTLHPVSEQISRLVGFVEIEIKNKKGNEYVQVRTGQSKR